MRIAYIVGPYRAESYKRRQENIAKATVVAKEFWKRGFAVICPHTNSANFDGICEDDSFLEGYLGILYSLSFVIDSTVIVLPGWRSSSGSRTEVSHAKEYYLNITYLTEEEYATFTD